MKQKYNLNRMKKSLAKWKKKNMPIKMAIEMHLLK